MGFAVCPIDTIVCHYAAKVQFSNYSKINLVSLFYTSLNILTDWNGRRLRFCLLAIQRQMRKFRYGKKGGREVSFFVAFRRNCPYGSDFRAKDSFSGAYDRRGLPY